MGGTWPHFFESKGAQEFATEKRFRLPLWYAYMVMLYKENKLFSHLTIYFFRKIVCLVPLLNLYQILKSNAIKNY